MSEEGKKRLRVSAPKLQAGEIVEVRSVMEGFLGSWRQGTVIDSGEGMRYVRYEKDIRDSWFQNPVELVISSNALDGRMSCPDCYTRGTIRPLPPSIEFEKRDLKFGLCVDVRHQDAWWEGVMFDHCEGEEERSVFFPDSGDEMRVGVDQFRITHDWDEVTENWEQRGNWVFLELIEESCVAAASAKQIWHDLRRRTDFRVIVGEWTFNVRYQLRNMVTEVVNRCWKLTVNETQKQMAHVST